MTQFEHKVILEKKLHGTNGTQINATETGECVILMWIILFRWYNHIAEQLNQDYIPDGAKITFHILSGDFYSGSQYYIQSAPVKYVFKTELVFPWLLNSEFDIYSVDHYHLHLFK